jgi:hypothetical protein
LAIAVNCSLGIALLKRARREEKASAGFFVSQRSGTRDKPFIMTQGGAYITEVSEHSEGHQQIHFKIAVPENCARMDVDLGEFTESFPRPHPSSEIIDFVRVMPSRLVLAPGDQLRVTFYESGDLPPS